MHEADIETRLTATVVVVTGAAPLVDGDISSVPDDAVVIAADGALDHALAAGLEPAVLVGDLDSVSVQGRNWASSRATVDEHDPDKDRTDTELALALAVDLNPTRLILLSGGGDRLDHTIAAVVALGHPSLTSIPTILGRWGGQRLAVLHGPGRMRLDPPVGTTLSVLALHGPCRGVTLDGVRWPLHGAELDPGVGLGVSNETTASEVDVSISSGVLTIVLTDAPARSDSPQEAP